MKRLFKNTIVFLNKFAKHIFCRYHFSKKCKKYVKENRIPQISKDYKKRILQYWKQFHIKPQIIYFRWYSYYYGFEDERFIPEGLFYDKIEPYFNELSFEKAYVDKAMFKKYLPFVNQPRTIISNINGFFYNCDYELISKNDAINMLINVDFIIKPSLDSGGGKEVKKILCTSYDELENILNCYCKDYIIQEIIQQEESLAIIHPNSVNTIRITSLFENQKVKILSSILRMGVGESYLDNECSGGVNCSIDGNGFLGEKCHLANGFSFDGHPNGFITHGHKINNYSNVLQMVKKCHEQLPRFKIISWDFSIDQEGNPILIEYNLSWCGLNFHQLNNGPLFGEETSDILKKIFK